MTTAPQSRPTATFGPFKTGEEMTDILNRVNESTERMDADWEKNAKALACIMAAWKMRGGRVAFIDPKDGK